MSTITSMSPMGRFSVTVIWERTPVVLLSGIASGRPVPDVRTSLPSTVDARQSLSSPSQISALPG